MGMSASQARFLSLTARKNNVEFEGQQINQQRTTLSNESASYYSELCDMAVPVPPSIDDYTKVSYTFNDGAMTNTLISLLPDATTEGRANNRYVVNYVEEWQDDYAIVPAVSSLVQRGIGSDGNPDGIYSIGSAILRKAGVGPDGSQITESATSTVTTEGSSAIDTTDPITNADTTDTTDNTTPVSNPSMTHYINITEDGTTTRYEVFYDEPGYPDGQPYYNKAAADLSSYEEKMIKYYDAANYSMKYFVGNTGNIYAASDIEQKTPVTINESEYIIATEDESSQIFLIGIVDGKYKKLDENGDPIITERVDITDYSKIIHEENSTTNSSIASTTSSSTGNGNVVMLSQRNNPDIHLETTTSTSAETKTGDDYWDSLTVEQRKSLLKNEIYLLKMVQEKSGDDGDFYIRYIKNTTTGNYEPYLYAESELEQGEKYNNKQLASIPCYSLGSTTQTREILHKQATIEKDSSGRYVAITIKLGEDSEGHPIERTYQLTATTTTDEEAYNDAMNQYTYKQHEYDHKIQEINSKLEIIQQQDKQLELKLKQLDTEENAISTEMDAVKKVISKNVESSFKTFNA